ncbi:Protein CBG10486 [Caenorhabditis briggsae]|uniref:Protein CBG10486 n=2 Tax=Caenorhabditis briggsae TaxID=6238 RepID=A8XAX0_CAEBR|nr:Protein CBG10486 [Caenorhabditis briggsae]ULT87019.1 hypothetical protein L3Y34_006642 [Caenorhabditis briggsae]CAP29898.1 Protein CBG10486 [Caenorhabditis briggsae]
MANSSAPEFLAGLGLQKMATTPLLCAGLGVQAVSTIYSTYDHSQFREKQIQLSNQRDEAHRKMMDKIQSDHIAHLDQMSEAEEKSRECFQAYRDKREKEIAKIKSEFDEQQAKYDKEIDDSIKEHKKNVESIREQSENALRQNQVIHRRQLESMDDNQRKEREALHEKLENAKKEIAKVLDDEYREIDIRMNEYLEKQEKKREERNTAMEKNRKEIAGAQGENRRVVQQLEEDKRKHFEEQKGLVLNTQIEISGDLIARNASMRCMKMYQDALQPVALRMKNAFNEMRTICDSANFDKRSIRAGSLDPFKDEIASAECAFYNNVAIFTQGMLSEIHIPLDIRIELNNQLNQIKKLLQNTNVKSHAALLALAHDKKDLEKMRNEMDLMKTFFTAFEDLNTDQQTLMIQKKIMDSLCAKTSQLKING